MSHVYRGILWNVCCQEDAVGDYITPEILILKLMWAYDALNDQDDTTFNVNHK